LNDNKNSAKVSSIDEGIPAVDLSMQEAGGLVTEEKFREKKLSGDILASFSGEVFLFLASFLLGVLTARYLGADGKGRFNVVYYAVGLLSIIFSLRLQRSFIYYLSKNKELLGEIISTSFLVGAFSIFCIFLFPILFHDFFYETLVRGIDINLLTLVFLGASVYLWNLLIALYAGLQLFKVRAFFMGASCLLKSALVILTMGRLQGDLDSLFLIMGVVETIVYTILILFLLPRTKSFRINPATFLKMFKYGLASFPGMVSDLITLRIDVFFVNFFVGASQVGIYTVAISIANMLLYIPAAMKSVLMPYIARQGNKEITPRLSRLLILVLTALAFVMIPVVWVALVPIYGIEFSYSRTLFLVLLPGTIFWGVFSLLSSDLEGRGLPWKASTISMASAVMTIILDIALIPLLGALGAAVVSSITYAFSMLLAVVLYRRLTGVSTTDILIPKTEDIRLLVENVSNYLLRLWNGRLHADFEKVFSTYRSRSIK
jgi:O-antigen/teichoic acid export membrane protein